MDESRKGRACLLRGSDHHQHQGQPKPGPVSHTATHIRSLDYPRVHRYAGTPVHGCCMGEVPSRLAGGLGGLVGMQHEGQTWISQEGCSCQWGRASE